MCFYGSYKLQNCLQYYFLSTPFASVRLTTAHIGDQADQQLRKQIRSNKSTNLWIINNFIEV